MKRLIPVIVLGLLFGTCKETTLVPIMPADACVALDELCNGIDDDCDGIIDNADKMNVEPCYDGNKNDLLYGTCRFGLNRCVDGGLECIGQIKPVPEVCNGLDDNCNGETDEGFQSDIDIVFVVDYSASMNDKLDTLNYIISQWTNKYGSRTDIKIALVAAPAKDENLDGQVIVLSQLTDVATFMTVMQNNRTAGNSGKEPTIDAVYLLSLPYNPLNINWTTNSRHVIFLFTDEMPQSYEIPEIPEQDAISTAAFNNVKVFIFTSEPTWRLWNPYPLNSSYALLSDSIDDAISKSACANRGPP